MHKLTLLLALGVTLAACVVNAQSPVIVGGQSILSATDAATLCEWVGEGPLSLTCLFSRSPGDGKSGLNFRMSCANRGRTFVVMEATCTDGQQYIIGGYNPQNWPSFGPMYVITNSILDRKGFVFNLTQGKILRQRTDAYAGAFQTYNDQSYGPVFGGGYDLYVGPAFDGNYARYYSYGDSAAANLFGVAGENTYFTVGRLDVFKITVVPEPSSTLPLLTGLAGISGMAVRRNKPSR